MNGLNHVLSVTLSFFGVKSRTSSMLVATITLLGEVFHDGSSVSRDSPGLLDKLSGIFPLSSD